MPLILIIVLVLALTGGGSYYGYSGLGPAYGGGIGIIGLLIILWLIFGGARL